MSKFNFYEKEVIKNNRQRIIASTHIPIIKPGEKILSVAGNPHESLWVLEKRFYKRLRSKGGK